MMLIRRGFVVKGNYVDGSWCEHREYIEARGDNEKELAEDVNRITQEKTSKGRQIDFGFIDGTVELEWEHGIYDCECKKYTPLNTQSELDL